MKKRFTLMMMVLCILMSIPLKMMAEIVTVHFVDKESPKWESYAAYVYDKTITGNGSQPQVTDAWPGQNVTNSADIETLSNGYKVVTWKIDLKSCALSNALIIFNNQDNKKQYPASGQPGMEVKNGYYYYSDGTMSDTAPSGTETGGGTGGGGGSDTPVEWNTVTTNRLTEKPRVYSKGFYLAGNFFSFQPKNGDNQITYDDAVFKFQQQKNDATIESGKDYEVYKVEIPASLKAHAQVMYVDEFGITKNIFGPGTTKGISRTCPNTDESTDWEEAQVNVCNPITQENSNYWNFASRNETKDEYSDGMYNLYIAVDATTHEVKRWKIEHDSDRRVAYFISDAPNATAMPVYDAFDTSHDSNKFSNKFYASVNFSAERNYYVISNYLKSQEYVSWTERDYETKKNSKDYVSTTNKLFLLGNGGSAYNPSSNTHLFSPNEKPMPGGDLGNIVVEYNPSNGRDDFANNDKHLGFSGQVMLANGTVKIKSVSMVGDAIPGTLKDDGSWDFTSKAADMIYDDVEQCYTTTIVTTVGDGEKHFRFVGNHDPKINWFEDTDGKEPEKMAKTPLSDKDAKGHTADASDPNKVNYTKEGKFSEDKYHVIWNRPAGRWTVRLYFYTYNVAGEPVTDYYYTISPCRDLELRDCVNIVYKSEETKRVIKNVGNYKFLRTWSDGDAWMVSKDIDIYVVDALTPDKDKKAVTIHLKQLDSKDKSGKYNVIPANTGVILGTTKEAKDIEGGAVFHERTSLTSLNTIVVPMLAYNASEDETAEPKVTSLLEKLIQAQVVPTFKTDETTGKVTYSYLFGAAKGKSVGIECVNDNDFFMGFWISNGKGNFYSNSCYLPIDEETANILGVGIRNNQFDPTTNAKRVPGVIFDFANVGGTTGINEVVNQSTKLNDGKYYTLSGQQVEKPTAGGIYIHNGRKFVVK